MRTTLTLDTDVSVELEALRRKRGRNLKDVVNDALRRGLRAMAEADEKPRPTFTTRSVDLGLPRLPLDNVAEALAAVEGEAFR